LTKDQLLILDCRDHNAFEQAHIPGARNISISNLAAIIDATPKDQPILIYCYHGFASQEYAQIFTDFRFQEVYSLDGGFEAWRRQAEAQSATTLDDNLRDWLKTEGFPDGDLEAVVGNDTTPLMRAAHRGRIDILKELIAAGAQLDARNADGNTALWLACVDNRLDAIKVLIKAGIDIDNRNDNDATALMYASSAGKADVVALLIAAGARLDFETLDGFSALDMAATLECLTLLRAADKAARRPADLSATA
jgi:thiosulfate/3-mercaptopyruvate sulfurtransferase